MPRLLAVGHVTWDRLAGQEVLGGSASYAALAATKLGWEAAVLTAAGADFLASRDLPGVRVFLRDSPVTTRFESVYEEDGSRRQVVTSRADDVDLGVLDDAWRNPDVLLLAPVAAEVAGFTAQAFEAAAVGAMAQGWLRETDAQGTVSPRGWVDPQRDLSGVHACFLAEQDLPDAARAAQDLLAFVPIVALTRGWEGLRLYTRDGVRDVCSLPRAEVDPTGAGDVFAASFLVRYHETNDMLEAAAFGACAASCVVEGLGTTSLGDRREVMHRMDLRRRLIEEGDWDE